MTHNTHTLPVHPSPYYIGLMSGTSLDGVDGVLVEISSDGLLRVLQHAYTPYDERVKHDLLALQAPQHDDLAKSMQAANAVSHNYAQVCAMLLNKAGCDKTAVRYVAAHGQTVRHAPNLGYSVQLLNAPLLAELCEMDVMSDFRSRDIAAGGQGAPLVPAFHAGVFGSTSEDRAVLNLGGIANLSLLPAMSKKHTGQSFCEDPSEKTDLVRGYDVGPCNILLDGHCMQECHKAYDDGGSWAASGSVNDDLLRQLWQHPFFARPIPKSTGRDDFHMAWLNAELARFRKEYAATALSGADIQATLAQLVAQSVVVSLQQYLPTVRRLIAVGGGARNTDVLHRLRALLGNIFGHEVSVEDSYAYGLPCDQVEAAAFAWLGWCLAHRRPANVPTVTGARGLRLLGVISPA